MNVTEQRADNNAPQTLFQTEYFQIAMEMVFAERRRQVQLGRDGKIPHACEDPTTDWGYRIGVLGEEYGEMCTEYIEETSDSDNMLKECIQTAAVAMACIEGVLRQRGLDPGDTFDTYPEVRVDCEQCGAELMVSPSGHAELQKKSHDEHLAILLRANRVRESRNATYKDVWKNYGWRGCLTHLRTCAERAFISLWGKQPGTVVKVDNLIDAINYAAFAIRSIEAGNRDGNWVYPED